MVVPQKLESPWRKNKAEERDREHQDEGAGVAVVRRTVRDVLLRRQHLSKDLKERRSEPCGYPGKVTFEAEGTARFSSWGRSGTLWSSRTIKEVSTAEAK